MVILLSMSFLKSIFGDENARILKEFNPIVAKVNAFEPDILKLTDTELRGKTEEFKKRLSNGETPEEILPEAFAVVREASKRTLGQRHFDVQIIGGVALHQGKISEMRTGEGKTLVATLPAYLNALSGKGVHIVTVNDYLSRRDAAWMGQIYSFLGLSVAVINGNNTSFIYDQSHTGENLDRQRDALGAFRVVHEFLRPTERKTAYQADITYGTNSEFGFDYLRDNIVIHPDDLVQRDFNYGIVDEIDSILIDEARTPLIISGVSGDAGDLYMKFAGIARNLKADEDFSVDEKHKQITITDSGVDKAEKALGVENIYTDMGIHYVHHLENAVKAKALFARDKEYVVKDGEIIIVDEFTGRLQPGRRWSAGLHQAIEAKEGVSIQKESRTLASITYQNYFRMYKKLSGMTGTAMTSSEEFYKVYGLSTLAIPTNMPIKRIDHDDLIFQTEVGKYKAIAREVKKRNEKGQPILIGTVSIDKNEMLSDFLRREGVEHEILNAKNHEREGEIIAQAGAPSKVTIATNMAGRGVDIKLGGNPGSPEAYEKVKGLGGLYVLGTERHEARRIDNQLRGRSGRQGDPGDTEFFVSMEDSLMRVFAADTVKKMMGRMGLAEDEAIKNSMITRSLESAQNKIEGINFDARRNVLQYDDVLNHQRKIIYSKRRSILLGTEEEVEALLLDVKVLDENLEKVIEEKRKGLGEEEFYRVIRRLFLQTIDLFWTEHLEAMDYMRASVGLRAYGQRDPLVEYKKDGLSMFKSMEAGIYAQVAEMIPNILVGSFIAEERKMEKEIANLKMMGGEDGGENSPIVASSPRTAEGEKVGRNDLCPCGSGKKFKKCHGK